MESTPIMEIDVAQGNSVASSPASPASSAESKVREAQIALEEWKDAFLESDCPECKEAMKRIQEILWWSCILG